MPSTSRWTVSMMFFFASVSFVAVPTISSTQHRPSHPWTGPVQPPPSPFDGLALRGSSSLNRTFSLRSVSSSLSHLVHPFRFQHTVTLCYDHQKTFHNHLVHKFTQNVSCKLPKLSFRQIMSSMNSFILWSFHLARHSALCSLLRTSHFVLFVELLVVVGSSTVDSVIDVCSVLSSLMPHTFTSSLSSSRRVRRNTRCSLSLS